ncbi:mitochondrial 50S ribosomal protein L22 [Cristinia sonorae]|uniref:Mitochondrial 50S ribosomal protein L22 n=1 Tax=Cristinia sonorae TaxID=1940300 RepID=A0A8K0UXB7_9AGAR|nr:mitochondrial 50S ribosomal protein L22 [Cristinia sonorae]
MQVASSSLRRGLTPLRSSQFPSTSRAVLRDARRYASLKGPLTWLRQSLAPAVRKDSEEDIAAARKAEAEKGQSSVFDSIAPAADEERAGVSALVKPKIKHTEHKYSTANFKISHRKLNMLGRQIAGQPIDMAIMQMNFSEKRASKRIKSMLVVAKDHATAYKGLDASKLVVDEAWVTKGPNVLKRIEPKGRGRFGVRVHPDSRLSVVLREGKTKAELAREERARKLKRIVSSGITREDVPLRNPGPAWAW